MWQGVTLRRCSGSPYTQEILPSLPQNTRRCVHQQFTDAAVIFQTKSDNDLLLMWHVHKAWHADNLEGAP